MRTVACGNFILLTSLDKSTFCGIISAGSLAYASLREAAASSAQKRGCGIDGFAKMPAGQAFLLRCEISAE